MCNPSIVVSPKGSRGQGATALPYLDKIEQIKFVYGDFKLESTLKYRKSAAPYWIISLIGMVGLYTVFSGEKHFYSLFFAFIAAVTFPHAFVMVKMFSKKKHNHK